MSSNAVGVKLRSLVLSAALVVGAVSGMPSVAYAEETSPEGTGEQRVELDAGEGSTEAPETEDPELGEEPTAAEPEVAGAPGAEVSGAEIAGAEVAQAKKSKASQSKASKSKASKSKAKKAQAKAKKQQKKLNALVKKMNKRAAKKAGLKTTTKSKARHGYGANYTSFKTKKNADYWVSLKSKWTGTKGKPSGTKVQKYRKALTQQFKKYKLKRVGSLTSNAQGRSGGLQAYANSKYVCTLKWNAHKKSAHYTPQSDAEFSCVTRAKANSAVKKIKPFYKASGMQSPQRGMKMSTGWGLPEVTNSSVAGYQRATAYSGGVWQAGGGSNYFAKASNGAWEYVGGGPFTIICSDAEKTVTSSRAWAGQRCYIPSTGSERKVRAR